MVGLIIATHGELGKAFKESVALLTGECKNVVTLALEKNDNSEEFREKMEEGIKQVDQGDGVILFTDVLGGELHRIWQHYWQEKINCIV